MNKPSINMLDCIVGGEEYKPCPPRENKSYTSTILLVWIYLLVGIALVAVFT